MAFSPLVDELKTTKKHSPRPGKVTRVIVHHWAHVGGIAGVLNKFVYSTRQSSVSYIMRNTGHLIGSVDERYRPWTSNSAAADNPAITIEIENETGAPNYKVSDASIEKLTQLLVDIARRHGWKQIRFGHEVRGHREFYATACPGPYLWPRLPAIAKEANRRLQERRNPTTSKGNPVSMKRTANTSHPAAQSAPKGKWRTLDVAPASKDRHVSLSPRNTNPALVVARAAISGLGHNDYVEFMLYHLEYDPKKGNGPINGILRHRVYGSGAQTDQALDSFLDLTRAVGAVPAGHRWRIRARASKAGVTVSNLTISVFQ